jgi:hypothetical protein
MAPHTAALSFSYNFVGTETPLWSLISDGDAEEMAAAAKP